MLLEAIPAVDWPLAIWLEGDLGLLPALRAGNRMHLAGRAVVTSTTAPVVVPSISVHEKRPFGFLGPTSPQAQMGIEQSSIKDIPLTSRASGGLKSDLSGPPGKALDALVSSRSGVGLSAGEGIRGTRKEVALSPLGGRPNLEGP